MDQRILSILSAIQAAANERVDPAYIAELAACAQTIMAGSSVEQAGAWAAAQSWIEAVAVERAKIARLESA